MSITQIRVLYQWCSGELCVQNRVLVCAVGGYLGIELSQEVKMLLEVGGENGLDDEEAEAFELHVAQVAQEVVLRVRQEEVPSCSSVVVLQNGAVIIQHSLHGGGGEVWAWRGGTQ